MRKITYLLTSLLLFACSIGASLSLSAQVTDLSSLSRAKSYTLTAKRGYLRVSSNGNAIYSTSGTAEATVANNQFAIYASSKHSGEYYLYNIGASKFVTATSGVSGEDYNSCLLSETPTHRFTINATNNSSYPWYFIEPTSNNWLNIGGSLQPVVDTWKKLDDGNQFTFVEAADISEEVQTTINNAIDAFEKTATVTYKYYIGSVADANLYKTVEDEQQIGGIVADAPTIAFATNTSSTKSSKTVVEGGVTVEVICTEDLPFKVSTSDTEYWYAFDLHSNDSGTDGMGGSTNYAAGTRTWLISYDGTSLANTNYAYATNEVLDDAYLWKVTGDLVNGFKFYNKNSGTNFLVKETTGDNACTFGTTEDKGAFKLYESSAVSGAFCIKLDGDDAYVNHRSNDGILRGWTKPDGGSSIFFREASSFPLAYYNANYASLKDVPAGALGGFAADASSAYTSAETAVNMLASDAFNTDATKSLISANTTLDGLTKVEVPSSFDGQYYRILSKNKKQYMTFATNNAGTYYLTTNADGTSVGSVVAFNLTADDATTYNLSAEGLKFGLAPQSLDVVPGDESTGTYSITHKGNGVFVLHNENGSAGTYGYLHLANSNGDGDVVGGGQYDDYSHWYLIPAEDVKVSLNAIEEKAYATAYLPFPVSRVEGADAYVGSTLSDNVLSVEKTENGAAANQGLVLVSESGTEGQVATLTIGESEKTGQVLTGTNVPITLSDDTRLSYLVLGVDNSDKTTVGFFKPSLKVVSIPANRAYIDNSSTASGAVRLSFGSSTGIENSLIIDNGEVKEKAPVYDLTGRRVTNATKSGVYIQNGKKFIVK